MKRTPQEVQEIVEAVSSWMVIAGRDKALKPSDAEASSLLKRLLSGEEPLPAPPPLSYNHPWYELVERGEARPQEVFLESPDVMIINSSPWRVVQENKSARQYQVEWEATGMKCELRKSRLRLGDNKWNLTVTHYPKPGEQKSS